MGISKTTLSQNFVRILLESSFIPRVWLASQNFVIALSGNSVSYVLVQDTDKNMK